MRRTVMLLVVALLAGCTHTVVLYPRSEGPQGIGTLTRSGNGLDIIVGDRRYTGNWILQGYGRGVQNNCAALLLDGDRSMRCEFVFDQMWSRANGVCTDYKNTTYDMAVK